MNIEKLTELKSNDNEFAFQIADKINEIIDYMQEDERDLLKEVKELFKEHKDFLESKKVKAIDTIDFSDLEKVMQEQEEATKHLKSVIIENNNLIASLLSEYKNVNDNRLIGMYKKNQGVL